MADEIITSWTFHPKFAKNLKDLLPKMIIYSPSMYVPSALPNLSTYFSLTNYGMLWTKIEKRLSKWGPLKMYTLTPFKLMVHLDIFVQVCELWNDFYLQAFVKFSFCPCKAQPQYLNKLFFICVYVRHRITEIFDIRQILMKTMESYEDKNAKKKSSNKHNLFSFSKM